MNEMTQDERIEFERNQVSIERIERIVGELQDKIKAAKAAGNREEKERLEVELDLKKKEYESALREYSSIEKEFNDYLEWWSGGRETLRKVKHPSGTERVFSDWTTRAYLTSLFVVIMNCDVPNVDKINEWAAKATYNPLNKGSSISLAANNNDDTLLPYDQVDIDAGVTFESTNTLVNSTHLGKPGPSGPNTDGAGDWTRYPSAEWIVRQWKRYKLFMQKMIVVDKYDSFLPQEAISAGPTGGSRMAFTGKYIERVKQVNNTRDHLKKVLFTEGDPNYSKALIPFIIEKSENHPYEYDDLYIGKKVFTFRGWVEFLENIFPKQFLNTNRLIHGNNNSIDSTGELVLKNEYKNVGFFGIKFGAAQTSPPTQTKIRGGQDVWTQKGVDRLLKPKSGLRSPNTYLMENGVKNYYPEIGGLFVKGDILSDAKGLQPLIYSYYLIFTEDPSTKAWFYKNLQFGNRIEATKHFKPGLVIISGDKWKVAGRPNKKEIDDIEDKLAKLDLTSEDDIKVWEREIISYNRDLNRLMKRNAELSKQDENRLLNEVHSVSKRVNTYLTRKPVTRMTWSWYEIYEDLFKKLQKAVKERLRQENKWKEDDDNYKNFKLVDPAIESYFKNSEDRIKKALGEIRTGYKLYDNPDPNNKGLKQNTAEAKGEAYRILRVHKLEGLDDKKIEEWVKNNNKTAQTLLKHLDELAKWIELEENENKVREKIRSSEAIAKDLEAMLKEILKGGRYKPSILDAWKKAGYGEGNRFYELITHKTDLRTDKEFTDTWLKGTSEGGPGYSKTFAEWIAEKSASDLKYDLLIYILKYRLNQFIKETTDGRRDYKKEVVLDWIKESSGCGQDEESFADITGGDGKKGNVVLREFVRSFVRKTADAMGLDIKNSSEFKIAEKWSKTNYKEETIKSLKDGMDEEFLKSKGKDAKSIWDDDPKKLHKEVRNYQINKEGITNAEELKKITAKDKERLEKVITLYEDLIDHGLATPEQIEFKKQLSSHFATLTTTDGKKPEGEEGGKKTRRWRRWQKTRRWRRWQKTRRWNSKTSRW